MPAKHFALTAAAFEGSLVLVAVALGWLLGSPPLATCRFDASGAAIGVAATLPMLAVFWLCLMCPWRPLRSIAEILDQTLIPLFRNCGVVQLLIIAAFAGIGEEMLFRGVLQSAVAEAIGEPYGMWSGLFIAAILFGLLHSITPMYAILAGLIGLYLGGLWLASGNLLAPIIAHGLYDFLALAYLVRRQRSGKQGLGIRD